MPAGSGAEQENLLRKMKYATSISHEIAYPPCVECVKFNKCLMMLIQHFPSIATRRYTLSLSDNIQIYRIYRTMDEFGLGLPHTTAARRAHGVEAGSKGHSLTCLARPLMSAMGESLPACYGQDPFPSTWASAILEARRDSRVKGHQPLTVDSYFSVQQRKLVVRMDARIHNREQTLRAHQPYAIQGLSIRQFLLLYKRKSLHSVSAHYCALCLSSSFSVKGKAFTVSLHTTVLSARAFAPGTGQEDHLTNFRFNLKDGGSPAMMTKGMWRTLKMKMRR
ncbi:hypothetical protein KSP40_PGU001746 [Platanthera guangdongensis]|uniref:Uncharacterized protein n=1 Tax=Platanthera guangdongensis TaxID=2320717 RepID=A0ABR2LT15_9ASPA